MATSLLDRGSVRLVPDFLPDGLVLYEHLASSVVWDTRIRARKSMSFGQPYNYSGIEWPATPFPDAIVSLLNRVAVEAGFEPNNCLANYYPTGESTMGFHSDSTAELEPGTGIAVVSLGAERIITFRRIDDKTVSESYRLPSGSLLWMCPEMQTEWRHAILADAATTDGRISLTFRRMRPSPQ
jgi:alkylated DNA repair dioxygenase AlkB